MSKKMLKRSLALGALMAFVITGSAMAAEVNETIKPSEIGNYTADGSLSVNVGTGVNGISAGNSTSDSSVNVSLTGNLVVNSGATGIGLRAENDNVAVESVIKADNIYINSSNGTGLDIYGHYGGKTKSSTFVVEAVNDLNIAAENGTYAVKFMEQRHAQSVTIKAGDELVLTGTVRADNAKQFNIEGKSVTIDADERVRGIYSDNSDVNVKATDKITINATEKGVYVASRYDDTKGVELNASTIEIEAEQALFAEAKGTLVVEATEKAEIKGDIISGKDSIVSVGLGNDVDITGDVLAQKGQIFVAADNNVTVNGNVESRSGEGSGHLPYVGINAGEDVVVNGSLVAHWAEGSKDGSRNEGLKIEGKNITVDAADADVLYNGAGKTVFVAEESLVLNGKNGLVNEGGTVNIAADNVDITAEDFAVISYSGTTEIAPTGSSNIIGDIFVDDLYGNSTPVVNMNLGKNGSLTGAVVNEHTGTGSGVNLDLGEGSTWTVTGDSNVTSLAGTDSNIKFDVNEEGNISTLAIATNDAIGTQVSGTGAVSDYLAANGKDAENTFADNVKGLDSDGVLTTEEGMTGGAYTLKITEDGVVAEQAVNTKSDAVSDAGMALKGHWRAHMNDMNKRMGELRMANGEHGVWTRMVRGESEYQGAKMQYNQYQLGYDEKLSVDKRWTVGAAVTFSEGDSSYGYGSTEDKSTAFAIYGSKLNNDGTFVDLIARYAHLESDLDDRNYGTGDYSTNGMSVSAEFGKRIQQGNGLWIEPQVEFTYGTVDSADVAFSKSYKAHYDSMDSFIARAGFALGKDIKQGNVYARASYLYDFDGETETQFVGGDPIKEDFGGGWWEVGVGANINLSKATYIYADIEKTFGGEVDTNWQWNLGVRYSF